METETDLHELLAAEEVSTADLVPFMRRVTPSLHDLDVVLRQAVSGVSYKNTLAKITSKKDKTAMASLRSAGGAVMLGSALEGSSDFGGLGWKIYKRLKGVRWDKQGEFKGKYAFHVRGPQDYEFIPDESDPFKFIRSNGEVIQPKRMLTDGGSTPRIAWAIPDLNPLGYLLGYLIHDWDFLAHHCRPDESRSFEETNITLAEGIYTMMMTGKVTPDWRKVEIVYQAVSSFVGRGVWNRPWTDDQCETNLGP